MLFRIRIIYTQVIRIEISLVGGLGIMGVCWLFCSWIFWTEFIENTSTPWRRKCPECISNWLRWQLFLKKEMFDFHGHRKYMLQRQQPPHGDQRRTRKCMNCSRLKVYHALGQRSAWHARNSKCMTMVDLDPHYSDMIMCACDSGFIVRMCRRR